MVAIRRLGSALRQAIAGLDEVLVIACKQDGDARACADGQVLTHKLGVFASDSYVDQAVLSSSCIRLWAVTYGSTMRTRREIHAIRCL